MSKTVIAEIKKLMRTLSLETLRGATGSKLIQAHEYQPAYLKADKMVFIAAVGWVFKIDFRVLFRFADLSEIRSQKAAKDEQLDFMKEYSNLVAGMMIRQIEAADRPMGVSIPVLNNFVPEVIDLNEQPPTKYTDAWVLSIGGSRITCMLAIQISDLEAFNNIRLELNPAQSTQSEADEIDSSGIEFL